MNINHAAVLLDHIREHAARYYPDHEGEFDIRLIGAERRRSAVLHRFQLTDAEQIRHIIVKTPSRRAPRERSDALDFKKPLLYPRAQLEQMHLLHYKALVDIEEYFTGVNRKELGAIRVLDYLPESQAVIMEESKDPSLRDLLLKESRLRFTARSGELVLAFHNVGTWLHLYHMMPRTEPVLPRHSSREDLVESLSKLADFLIERTGYKTFLDRAVSILTHRAREILPEILPLGLGHGDYAMRNILVGSGARVIVIDTFAKWRTPIYEDIGYFLTGLKMTSEQVASQGLMFSQNQLRDYEQAFLKGYFGQKTIPYPPIRLYEMLALLDKWSSVIVASYKRGGKWKWVGDTTAALASHFFKTSAERLLTKITAVERTAASMDPERSY
jgi:tRNA A-37 threonylcarbamoyl transferase component Bud32